MDELKIMMIGVRISIIRRYSTIFVSTKPWNHIA